MIKSELPMEPVQRVQPEGRTKPAPDAPETGDFARWIQPEDPAAAPSRTTGTEVVPADHDRLATAMVLSSTAGVATGVLYGWGLQAQGALSQWVVDILHGAGAASGRESIHPVATAYNGTARRAGDMAVPRAIAQSASTQAQSHASASALHRFSPDRVHATDAGNAAHTQDAMAAPLLWSERTLRRVSTQDGGTTVWLRDYRLSSDEIATALAELLAQPSGAGPVTRVVINGVEVWRQAPSTPQEIA